MKTFKNITIIGTSHISKESIIKIKRFIDNNKIDIIALELDSARAYALQTKKKPKRRDALKSLGLLGFIIYTVAEFVQRKLGKIVDVTPGEEMLIALEKGKEKNCSIFLIDRRIDLTLRRLAKSIRKIEIIRIVFDIISSPFRKEKIKINLTKVPDERIIDDVIKNLKHHYPSIYKVLIDERNRIMAERLFNLYSSFPDKKILAIVGAGHVKGILYYLKSLEERNF